MERDAAEEPVEAAEEEAISLGEVVATIELTEADYVDAYLSLASHRKQIRPLQKMIGVVLGVTLLVVALAWPVRPGLWTAMAALCAAGLFLVRHQWVYVAKRAFRHLHERRRRYQLVVDEEGRFAKGPRAEVRSAWATVSGWLETDRVVVLFSPLGLVDLFPKRAFDESQLATLRALFGACIVEPPPAPAAAPPEKKGGLPAALKTFLLWVVMIGFFTAVYWFLTRSS